MQTLTVRRTIQTASSLLAVDGGNLTVASATVPSTRPISEDDAPRGAFSASVGAKGGRTRSRVTGRHFGSVSRNRRICRAQHILGYAYS